MIASLPDLPNDINYLLCLTSRYARSTWITARWNVSIYVWSALWCALVLRCIACSDDAGACPNANRTLTLTTWSRSARRSAFLDWNCRMLELHKCLWAYLAREQKHLFYFIIDIFRMFLQELFDLDFKWEGFWGFGVTTFMTKIIAWNIIGFLEIIFSNFIYDILKLHSWPK